MDNRKLVKSFSATGNIGHFRAFMERLRDTLPDIGQWSSSKGEVLVFHYEQKRGTKFVEGPGTSPYGGKNVRSITVDETPPNLASWEVVNISVPHPRQWASVNAYETAPGKIQVDFFDGCMPYSFNNHAPIGSAFEEFSQWIFEEGAKTELQPKKQSEPPNGWIEFARSELGRIGLTSGAQSEQTAHEHLTNEVFTSRFFACHSLPCRPYRGLQAFEDNELPDWNCDFQYFLEIKKKVDALIAIIPPAWNVSELQQCFNDITARGRQTIFEKEILWLWGGDMSSLMEKSEITEDNKITHDNIGQRILEHEEYEEKQLARNEVGERIDPPKLEPSNIFWTSLKWEGHHHANWNEMQRAQEIRRVWLKVYEELATLHDTHTAAPGQAGGNKRKIRDSTQKRAEMYKAIKDANPRLSYQAVAMRAQRQLAEQGQVEEVTGEDVRNAYRAKGWQWKRADKIR
jgi:hypothetical protein